MKLRNKKTGEIVDAWSFYYGDKSISLKYFTDDGQVNLEYYSLSELNDEWEDYKPKEPLIKDWKIRKAVRAWAEASGATSIVVFDCNNAPCLKIDEMEFAENGGRASISFKTSEKIGTNKAYTIEELCGEDK